MCLAVVPEPLTLFIPTLFHRFWHRDTLVELSVKKDEKEYGFEVPWLRGLTHLSVVQGLNDPEVRGSDGSVWHATTPDG